MTIGTSDTRRMARHTSKPSMPGSMMSISTTSAGWRWKALSASSPVSASSTDQPSSSSASLTAVRMRSSSSTVRMRVPTVKIVPHPRAGCAAGRARVVGSRPPPPPSVDVAVRGQEGVAAGAAAGAVVEALGQAGPEVAADDEGTRPGLGVGLERPEVDVDAAGPALDGGGRGGEQGLARRLIEAVDDGQHDGRAVDDHVDG